MKSVILFRHGKSRWDVGVRDFDRDLEAIGIERSKKSAEALSKTFHKKIDAWYSSPAQRAKHTAKIAVDFFPEKPIIQLIDELYTFSFFDLLKFLKSLDNNLATVICFGHNEAFTEFVNRMGNQHIDNLPTSGVATIEFPVQSWKEIEKGQTKFIIKPKNL